MLCMRIRFWNLGLYVRRALLMRGRHSCLRNVVTLFHYIEKERVWRRENGRPEGFEGLLGRKPIGELMA